MENTSYFHMFANGDYAKNLIISESDFFSAFNLIGVCAANTAASVVSFSIEETHPHLLLYGTQSDCHRFKIMYEQSLLHHISSTRGTRDNVCFNCEMYAVTNEDYLRNVAAYTVVQPTKDGKKIMPYDYLWGTASMYFRSNRHVPVWLLDCDSKISEPVPIGALTYRQRIRLLSSKRNVPANWLICNGFLLPSNYVDVERFEAIYGTPNCFRVFMANNKKRDETVICRMAKVHGIDLEDLEARHVCEKVCLDLFGKRTARWLDTTQRLTLAMNLRRCHKMSFRQISILSRLPEAEIRKYMK